MRSLVRGTGATATASFILCEVCIDYMERAPWFKKHSEAYWAESSAAAAALEAAKTAAGKEEK